VDKSCFQRWRKNIDSIETKGNHVAVCAETKSDIAGQRRFHEGFSARWDPAMSLLYYALTQPFKSHG